MNNDFFFTVLFIISKISSLGISKIGWNSNLTLKYNLNSNFKAWNLQGWMVAIRRKNKNTCFQNRLWSLIPHGFQNYSPSSCNEISLPLADLSNPMCPLKPSSGISIWKQIVFKIFLTPMTLDSYLPRWLLAWLSNLVGQWGSSKCDTSKDLKSNHTLKLSVFGAQQQEAYGSLLQYWRCDPIALVAQVCEWGHL